MTQPSYREFLEAKRAIAPTFGVAEVMPDDLNPLLKPHQRDIALWAARGGRRAIFANFGLGKTFMQLEAMRAVVHVPALYGKAPASPRGLIVAPLGVRQEFLRDAQKLGIDLRFIRSTDDLHTVGDFWTGGLYLTNYESVREGKIDARMFRAVSLDEAAILRGFGGTKTFREFMRLFEATPYRFVATATPSPNEYIEILSYAAFLGIMDVGEGKTRFFKRNSEKADKLTLHPHKVDEFWHWVHSWAVFLQRPSELGYSDEGYDLPPLTVNWQAVNDERIEDDLADGVLLRDNQASGFGVQQAAAVRRASLTTRVQRVVEIVRSQRVHAAVLPAEQTEIQRTLEGGLPEESGQVSGKKQGLEGGEPRAISRNGAEERGQESRDPAPPESGVVREEQDAGESNESTDQASALRAHAGAVRRDAPSAEGDMPDLSARDHSASSGSLPQDQHGARDSLPSVQRGAGAAFGDARGAHASSSLPDQIVIWCDLNDEQEAIEKALRAEGITVSSLYGNQGIDERETLLEQWRQRETTVFLSKPVMYGAGVNLQQSHTAIFAGVGFKFADFVQATHRCHRFLQEHPVTVHIVHAESEAGVVKRLQEKWARHDAMMARMSEIVKQYGLHGLSSVDPLARTIGVEPHMERGEGWIAFNNDCVDEMRSRDVAFVDLIITSIPFGTQYEYTPSYNDFGHTDDDRHFWAQMDYLAPELLRALKPGRVMCVHVKDRIRPGGMDGLGFQTASPFHADAIHHYRRHGFAYLGMITVVTDVVRENNQTYRLGWTEQCKDGSRMGVGMPEYVLLFRKPPTDASDGYADERVVKSKAEYSRARWQIDAHAFWRSSGDRLLTSDDLVGLPADEVFRLFRSHSFATIYDHEEIVALGEALENAKRLPPGFMLLQPQSAHPDVWTDVARMRTMNTAQSAKGREQHLCPMPLDIVKRLIVRYSNEGELVLDPFAGLFTVPLVAVENGRRGQGIELNARYFDDGVRYLRAAKCQGGTLFDLLTAQEAAAELAAGDDEPVAVEEVPS